MIITEYEIVSCRGRQFRQTDQRSLALKIYRNFRAMYGMAEIYEVERISPHFTRVANTCIKRRGVRTRTEFRLRNPNNI